MDETGQAPAVSLSGVPRKPIPDYRNAREIELERLIGAWNLVAWFEMGPDRHTNLPSDNIGKLVYTGDGHVSAQIVQKKLDAFRHDNWKMASDAEIATAWKSYFGYFGTYSVDTERKLITHHIEGAFFPNLTGTDQVRRYHFEGTRLVLDADTEWGRVRAVWERTPAA